MDRFRALRPSLERQEGRPAKREQRLGAELAPPGFRSAAGSSGRAGRQGRRCASGDAAKASQPSRPTMPASTIVRMSANSPARSLSSRSKAPRGTRPVLRMAENTVSTSAPVTRIVLRGGGVLGLYAHVSPVGLHTNHLAPNLRVAQNSIARRRERERRNSGGSHWTQLIAKSVTACFAPVSSPAALGIPTISTPGRLRR